MSISFEKVADRLFSIIKGSCRTVSMFDAQGVQVYDPLKARRFFAEPDAMMITLLDSGDNSAIQLYLSEGTAIEAVERLLVSLRQTATHYNLMWKVRKFSRKLSPKDFAYQADIEKEIANEGIEMTKPVAEAMVGSSRSSYEKVGRCRVIVRHAGPVDETVIGARGRNIKEIFVENGDGERLRMPASFLPGARAMARHCSSGGEYHDTTGETILGLVREWRNLRGVTGYIKENGRVITDMSEARLYGSFASNRMAEITETLRKLSGARGYPKAVETLTETTFEADDAEVQGEVDRIIDVLGVDEGNEPFLEGCRSLARQSLRHRGMVGETTKLKAAVEDDGLEVEDEADLGIDADGLTDPDGVSEGNLTEALGLLMGDPAVLDFDPDKLSFTTDESSGEEPPVMFGSPTEEITVKLKALAEAVTDPALADYLSDIHEKLSRREAPEAEEKRHMARALAVAGKADGRLKIGTMPTKKSEPVQEAAAPVRRKPTSLDSEVFGSLFSWIGGFAPERILSESFAPSDFKNPQGNAAKDRFGAGETVALIPTPEINSKALPEANWLKNKTMATLKGAAIKGTLDIIEVELQDGSTKKIYGFNIADRGDRKTTGGFEVAAKPTVNETTEVVDSGEIANTADQIADVLGASEGGVIEITDVGDLATAESLLQEAGLLFDTEAGSNRLIFDTPEDAATATDLLDKEGIPHDNLGEEYDSGEDDLDGEDALDGEQELDETTLDILGGDMTNDFVSDVSRNSRMDMTGVTPGVFSDEHTFSMAGDADARRAMQVLDDAGIEYSAYAPGRFEFRSAEDVEAAEEALDAAGLYPSVGAGDPVSFMAEMRQRLAGLI